MNKGKSCFIMDKDISTKRINIVSRILQVKKEEFPITYLGCPLFIGKKKNEYFADMATKIIKKISSWQCNRLSTGGKIILIKHALNTMPIYLLSMCQPTKTIMYQIKKIFANFLRGSKEGKQKYHWVAWDKLYYPKKEGDIGIRSTMDISESLGAKIWWQFRNKDTIWTRFMKAKYSKRIHPMARKVSYKYSKCWRRMMMIKEEVDHLIQ
ncbi:hypothetical protein AABB24_006498 [Solanum stoloniferum]